MILGLISLRFVALIGLNLDLDRSFGTWPGIEIRALISDITKQNEIEKCQV